MFRTLILFVGCLVSAATNAQLSEFPFEKIAGPREISKLRMTGSNSQISRLVFTDSGRSYDSDHFRQPTIYAILVVEGVTGQVLHQTQTEANENDEQSVALPLGLSLNSGQDLKIYMSVYRWERSLNGAPVEFEVEFERKVDLLDTQAVLFVYSV